MKVSVTTITKANKRYGVLSVGRYRLFFYQGLLVAKARLATKGDKPRKTWLLWVIERSDLIERYAIEKCILGMETKGHYHANRVSNLFRYEKEDESKGEIPCRLEIIINNKRVKEYED